jgi:hypothetical protein
LDAVRALGDGLPGDALAKAWSPVEWQVYLTGLGQTQPLDRCAELDRRFALTQRDNYEILCEWLSLSVRSGYAPAVERTKELLGKVGRMKYLKPLYLALTSREETRAVARDCFARFHGGYHPIAAHVIEGLLSKPGPSPASE